MTDSASEIEADEADGRRGRQRSMFVGAAAAALVLGVGALGCGGGDTTGGETTATTASGSVDCTSVSDDGGSEDCPTEVITDPAGVVVSTSEGDFEIELATDDSPATTTSFRDLVDDGFYDGLTFSRVVPGFVIQAGDPLADDPQLAGSGGPGYYVDEPVPEATDYTRGVVAMAKTATDPPGRSGSQFFVVSGPDAGLPADYAYVGTVTSGLETVASIEALGVGDGPPRKEVTIESMKVVPAT